MSKILALDCSSNACSAALLIDDSVIERYELAPRQHAQLILPMVQELLAEAELTLTQLDAIAFGCGPGSFTGIRIAAGITQGLAFGADLPTVAISSLQALAQGAYRDYGVTRVLAGFDARMQEVYWGAYQLDAASIMQPVIADCLHKPDAVPVPKQDTWIGVGDAWSSYQNTLSQQLGGRLTRAIVERYPHALDIAQLGNRDFLLNKTTSAAEALPVYLRSEAAWKKTSC